jgi:ABC-2 type transport system permease protein
MKLIDIALKDLYRSFRNAMFLVFGLALPMLTAALFYLAFGGLGSDDGGFELPPTQVQVVNLDAGQMGFSAGDLLVDVLRNAIPGVIQVSEASDVAEARTAVDQQQAAVAIVIPAGLTAAVFDVEGRAAVELYQDPTLTLMPGIVKGIISQVVDGFAGAKIATATAHDQLSGHGASPVPTTHQGIAMQYADWSAAMGEDAQTGASPFFDVQTPAGLEKESAGEMTTILGLIMAGMMVFYVFFTGAASAQSILQEEEAGTLPRLFTTPTPQSSILGGKFIATFLLLAVQVVVLVVISSLIFRIDWGEPLPVALVTLGLIVLAASFGILITSLLKDTRQAGIVYGGVMTVMGMIGMMSVFTAGVPGASDTMDKASLVVPHGWGVRGWRLLLEGGSLQDILLTVAVMLAAGAVFFAIGVLRFRKRYA